MRTIEYDVQTNIAAARKVLGALVHNSISFIPKKADDLTIQCEEEYTDGADNLKGRIIVHLDSKMANFHVDICSEMVPTSLYNSKAIMDNLMEFLNLRDFHRTKYAKKGFKNGRIIYTYSK